MRLVPVRLFLAFALLAPTSVTAQDVRKELRDSQLRLEQIRQERQQLQKEREELRSRVHDVSGELANIERQVSASATVLKELEFQSAALGTSIAATSQDLVLTRDRLRARTVLLQQRLRSIYKRGPLHAVRVLFSAESFGDLLSRYKYLHLIALYDRLLVESVRTLEQHLATRERELRLGLAELERNRAEKLQEFAQLQRVETEHERSLRLYRQRERIAESKLEQLARDEARLTDLLAELERKRLEAERRRVIAGGRPEAEGALSTRDIGALDWPVEGEVIYRFGPERRPNGVTLRWNGVGIAAAAGTAVRAVEAGTVMTARPLEGYGPSVVISHGGGYYTLYLHLKSLSVREGQRVEAKQVVGTVGGERTAEGAHMEFQVRAPLRGGGPEPVDPLTWLRTRGGS
ncbi:MAG: peptidoglycan DD-metalloendopeptidase family protein [Gemmatimonadetes bacterium]|nr:peptidoglycan DD-metalloendopeptidase family protein [Gemmatimonadota bacterium]